MRIPLTDVISLPISYNMLNIKQLYNKIAQIGLYGKRLINQVITISTTVKGIPINKK